MHFAAKPDDFSLISGTHVVQENWLLHFSFYFHKCMVVHTLPTDTHIQVSKSNKNI